jgi:hypothetical protein
MRQTLKMVDPPFYFPLVDNDLGIVHLFGTGSATAHCDQGFTPVRTPFCKQVRQAWHRSSAHGGGVQTENPLCPSVMPRPALFRAEILVFTESHVIRRDYDNIGWISRIGGCTENREGNKEGKEN